MTRQRLFLSKKFMADIRPEFSDDVIEAGSFDLCSPVFRRFAEATLLAGVIEVRQTRFHAIPNNLREVKA